MIAATPAIRCLGIVRLERLFLHEDGVVSQSSVASFFRALAAHVGSLSIVCPVARRAGPAEGLSAYPLRSSDRVYPLPDVRGYVRVFLWMPLIALQLMRLRRTCDAVLCRAPEHGNLLLLLLLRLLRFRMVLWLVGDRAEAERADRLRRAGSLRARAGLLLSRWTGAAERRFLASAPVIANGSRLARYACSLRAGRDDVLEIVSSTLPRASCPRSPRPPRPPGDRPLELLFVGRLAPDKGLQDLLDAVALCRGRDVVLRLVGWSAHGEEERLRARVRERGLGESVVFAGPKSFGPELFELYRRADLFVLPSHAEGTPRVLVEAMAFGLPVVATRAGGIPDVVEDGRNGILVEAGQPPALARAILDLARDPDAWRRISVRNRRKARALTVDGVAARMARFVGERTRA